MTADSIGQIVGENLRRLRIAAGESQAEAAQRLDLHGLSWTRDHVASLENGRRSSVSIDELLIMSWAYGTTLGEWFLGPGEVQLSPTMTTSRNEVREALRGKKRKTPAPVVLDFSNVVDLEADERVAARLGVDVETVTAIAREKWDHTLTDERNHRLAGAPTKDPKALRTLRGGMTKRLMREVEQYLKEGR